MTGPADGEFTEQDLDLLDELRDLYTEIDPMPPDLAALSRFALDIEETTFELVRPDPDRELVSTASRGQNQYITFDGDLLTMVVSVQDNDDDTRRVDGHIAPRDVYHIHVRTREHTLVTESHEDGRFTVHRVPAGPAQFIVRVGDTTVVSPALHV